MKNIQPKLLLVLGAMLLASVFRVIPHWPNFTPMAAIALMGGAYVSDRRLVFIIPLAALLVSDLTTVLFVNSQWTTISEHFTSPATLLVYLCFIAMTAIGLRLRKRQTFSNMAWAAIACSVLFFLVTNFGVWLVNELPKDASGLMGTYVLGLPFFRNDLLGNLFYTFIFFGAIRLACSTWPVLAHRPVL